MRGFINEETVQRRIDALLDAVRAGGRHCDTIMIVDKVNQYYFTGTMQDGLFVLRTDGFRGYFVRRSYERALEESPLSSIFQIRSYRDMLEWLPEDLGDVLLETSVVPLAMLDRLKRVFKLGHIHAAEPYVMSLRMFKSQRELDLIRESGRLHNQLLTELVPGLLREGMSEAELLADIFATMVKGGHHGVSRFGMFQMDMIAGQIGFGENSLYPTSFDGPGGMRGMSPAVPGIGSRERLLKKGDLVFVDVAYGIDGYHSDKTQVYCYGAKPAEEAVTVHRACMEVLRRTADLMRPGALPEEIYNKIVADLPPQLEDNFMGYGSGKVNFLGHGVGLQVDEPPVLARGFKNPLAEGMVIAVEPKSGLTGIGMTGVEETFVIGADATECVTGGPSEIIIV